MFQIRANRSFFDENNVIFIKSDGIFLSNLSFKAQNSKNNDFKIGYIICATWDRNQIIRISPFRIVIFTILKYNFYVKRVTGGITPTFNCVTSFMNAPKWLATSELQASKISDNKWMKTWQLSSKTFPWKTFPTFWAAIIIARDKLSKSQILLILLYAKVKIGRGGGFNR